MFIKNHYFNELAASDTPLLIVNGLQTVFALVVIGLVAGYTGSSSANNSAAVYAIVISIFTLLTTPLLAYYVIKPPSRKAWLYSLVIWEFLLGILWAVSAGLLGGESLDGGGKLRAALGFCLVEMASLLVLSVLGCVGLCCAGRKIKKLPM